MNNIAQTLVTQVLKVVTKRKVRRILTKAAGVLCSQSTHCEEAREYFAALLPTNVLRDLEGRHTQQMTLGNTIGGGNNG